jgi:putative ABC transport system substrate-binding protein
VNNRRSVLIALGAGALTAPLSSFAQPQGKVWCVGFLSQQRLESFNYGAFQQAMRELGYVEGKNVRYEARYMAGKFERVPEVAAELLRLNADAIVVGGGAPTLGAKAATRTVPIVMVGVGPIPSVRDWSQASHVRAATLRAFPASPERLA